jgi:hypothetical protein
MAKGRGSSSRLPVVAFGLATLLASSSVWAQARIVLSAPVEASRHDFERVRAVRELGDGSLLSSDRRRNELLHLRSLGDRPVVLGRSGSGPGEYRTAGDLWPLGGDSTLFTDLYSGRWLVLEGARIVATLAESRRGNLLVRGVTDGASRAGEVIALRRFDDESTGVRLERAADSFVVVRGRINNDRVDSVAVIAGAGPGGYTVIPARPPRPSYVTPVNPLAMSEHVVMQRDGWIAIVRVAPYRVDWRRPDGSWIRGPVLPMVPRPVTRVEQCEAIARAFTAAWPCDPSEFNGWPSKVPPVRWFNPQHEERSLLELPRGRVAIARTPLSSDRRRPYDVVDRRGQLVATFTLALGEVLVGSSERHAYVAHTDEDGLQSLRRYVWPGPLRESGN